MKIKELRALLATEGWTAETVPYANAYQRFTVDQVGYSHGNSNQPTQVAARCTHLELWSADPANEPGYQRGHRVLFAFDANGKVLRSASWADGTTVWAGVSLTVLADTAARIGRTGQQQRAEQATRSAADNHARHEAVARGERLAADATNLLAELGHDTQLRVGRDGTTVNIDLETLLAVLRTATRTGGDQ